MPHVPDLKVAEFLMSCLPDNSGAIIVLKGAGKNTWKVFINHEQLIVEGVGLTMKEACQNLKEKINARQTS